MNRLKAWIRTVFGFSQSETNAFIVLLPLMLVIISSEPVYQAWFTSGKPNFSEDQKRLDSLIANWEWPKEKDSVKSPVRKLFPFDPNLATVAEFSALGINERLANRIINYREKGGKFRVKSDLKKMYGLDSLTYHNLLPHIRLPEQIIHQRKDSVFARSTKIRAVGIFDMNLADTTMLKSIYGIGTVMASRIINYRTKLGGFVGHHQLFEVWGLDSLVIDRLISHSKISQDFIPVRLSINTAGEKQLSDHPYLRSKLAKAISLYRFQHGPFAAFDDLKKISLLDEKTFLRIKPYLTLE